MLQLIKETIVNLIHICGIYIVWSAIHLVSANLYTQYCAELSVVGYFYSLLTTMSPHCRGLLYLITTGNDVNVIMWKTLGSWIITKIIYASIVKVKNNAIK